MTKNQLLLRKIRKTKVNIISAIHSRSHHYVQLGNAHQKHLFTYSTLIIGTLKSSTGQFFNFSAQSQNFYRGSKLIRLPLIFPCNQKWMSIKIPHIRLIWKITYYWSFFTKRRGWSWLYICSYVSSKLLITS